MLCALDFYLSNPKEIAIVGKTEEIPYTLRFQDLGNQLTTFHLSTSY